MSGARLSFVSDYDVDEAQFRRLLAGELRLGRLDRTWAAVRVIEYGSYADIVRLLGFRGDLYRFERDRIGSARARWEGLHSDFRVATEGFTGVNRRLDGVEPQAARTEQRVDVLETRVAAVEGPKNRRRRPRSS